jgi:hypothetical protein
MMQKTLRLLLAIALVTLLGNYDSVEKHSSAVSLRAPAYPLITIDPYTSAWSMADHLYDAPVRHWTGKVHSLIGAIRVDGEVYRFLGKEELPLKPVVPMASDVAWEGLYTYKTPPAGWEQTTFDSRSWTSGKAAFGSSGMKAVNTVWNNKDRNNKEIWVRREFIIPNAAPDSDLFLIYSHDDDFELYLNGRQIVNTGNHARQEVIMKLDRTMLSENGKNVIAVHCLDRGGLAYVDFGIFTESSQKEIFTKTVFQEEVSLSATQTYYSFACGPVNLKLKFISPLLPDDLDLLSRPVNYVTYETIARDGKQHDVEIYFEITPQWAVNEINQEIEVSEGQTGSVGYLKAGTTSQRILEKAGDNVRIDWGYAYLSAALKKQSQLSIGEYSESKERFRTQGGVAKSSGRFTGKMTEAMPVMSYADDLDKISGKPVSGYIMIGYDDVASIQYFRKNLKAWWTQGGKVTMDQALTKSASEYNSILKRCNDFDSKLWSETLKAGGKRYADLCVLAFRQSVTAHKLTKDSLGNILFLSKENFSNGSIGTVDVTYPSAPLFLKYNPDLLKGMMNPIFYYSESGKWTKPFAAHDVGTYPKANGQTYGDDMPVEECGNMLILAAAIAKMEGNANYAGKHWEVLSLWANYLLKNGLDPENQLCTDDFAGHFAHNTNLSIKAIMGIAAYSMLAEVLGKKDEATSYKQEASRMAREWEKMADDGDHYRLTFDQPGTWSQKYNMVWDKLLDFNLFPKEIAKKEIAYYLTKQNTYGLPLDNRRTYTKSDWIVWTATLADDQATFQKFIDPLHAYVTNTPNRVPMSDWYETTNAKQVGFQARSVVGGYFIKLLEK